MVRKNKNHIKMTSSDRVLQGTCYTLLSVLFLITLYPMYFILVASFSEPNAVSSGRLLLWPEGFQLAGYSYAMKEDALWLGYVNTIFYATCGTLLGLAVSLSAAYALSRKDMPGRGILMLIFVFTMYFGGGMIPTYLVIKQLGLVNTRMIMILSGSISVYNIILIRTFFQSTIPDELRDAAFIDGCGNLRFFVQIALPLSKAIIAVISLYLIVGHWNSYFSALIYLNDKNKYPLQIALRGLLLQSESVVIESSEDAALALLQRMRQVTRYSIIVLATFPILCAYPFLQKYFVKGVMIGSLKG